MAYMVWHSGTGIVLAADDCSIVDVPDDVEDSEEWIRQNKPTQFPLGEILDAIVDFGESLSE